MNERMNIRRMQVPDREEAKDIPFDPKKEVTTEDWGIIEGFQSGYMERRDWKNFLNFTPWIKVLDPQRCPPISEETFDAICQSELEPYEQDMPKEYFENLYRLKVLDPARAGTLSDTEKEVLQRYVEADREATHKDRQSWDYFVHIAAKARVLDPSYVPDIPKSDWIGIAKRLDELRRADTWNGWMALAASARVILPNFSTDLAISPEQWDEMKQWYHDNKTSAGRKRMLYQAAQMKMLAAEEFKVTDQGFEINMRKKTSLRQETEPQPAHIEI